MQVGEVAGTSIPLWKRLIFGRRPKVTVARAAVLASVCAVVFNYILIGVRVEGISMEPNYHNGRINIINQFAYCRRAPQRRDVVGIRLAGKKIMYMKRIIGLPGERVAFRNGKVLINGEPLDEPYVKYRAPWQMPERILEPDEYYVVGDNRGMPQDLHEQGPIERDRIVGKVLF